jgi:UDP-glucuronate 4-epimerase
MPRRTSTARSTCWNSRANTTKQFVFGSSSSVYGENEKVPFAEDDIRQRPSRPTRRRRPRANCCATPTRTCTACAAFALRFFTVYGARQRPDLAIHKFAKLISEGKPIPVFGDGTTRRDYTYIDDIIAGVRAAIDYEASDYEVFNLGESRTVELRRVNRAAGKRAGREAMIDRQPMQPGDVPQTFADISKARRRLGYDPQTPIEEGIRRFVEWFKGESR